MVRRCIRVGDAGDEAEGAARSSAEDVTMAVHAGNERLHGTYEAFGGAGGGAGMGGGAAPYAGTETGAGAVGEGIGFGEKCGGPPYFVAIAP